MLFDTVAVVVPGARAVLRRLVEGGGTASYEEVQDHFAGGGHVQAEPLREGVVGVDQRHSQVPTLPGAGRELARGLEPGATGAQDQGLVLRRCCRIHRSAASFVSVVPAMRTTTRRKPPFRS